MVNVQLHAKEYKIKGNFQLHTQENTIKGNF